MLCSFGRAGRVGLLGERLLAQPLPYLYLDRTGARLIPIGALGPHRPGAPIFL